MDSPFEEIFHAAEEISLSGIEVDRVSRAFRTPSFPAGSGPDFVNAAIACETALSAQEVLAHLHAIEARAGRDRAERWGPRVLDLDLLAMGDMVLPDDAGFRHWAGLPLEAQMQRAPDQLILPHPRLHERAFVLVPLMDVAPDWRHPVLGRTVAEMHAALDPSALAEIHPL